MALVCSRLSACLPACLPAWPCPCPCPAPALHLPCLACLPASSSLALQTERGEGRVGQPPPSLPPTPALPQPLSPSVSPTKPQKAREREHGNDTKGKGSEWHCHALARLLACLPACVSLPRFSQKEKGQGKEERGSKWHCNALAPPPFLPSRPCPTPALISLSVFRNQDRKREREKERAREGQGGEGQRMALSCFRLSTCLIAWLLAGRSGAIPCFSLLSCEELGWGESKREQGRRGKESAWHWLARAWLLASLLASLALSLPLLAPRTQREKGEFGRRGEGGEVASPPLPCPSPYPPCPALPACVSLPRPPDKERVGRGRRRGEGRIGQPSPAVPAPCPLPFPSFPLSLQKERERERGRERERECASERERE